MTRNSRNAAANAACALTPAWHESFDTKKPERNPKLSTCGRTAELRGPGSEHFQCDCLWCD